MYRQLTRSHYYDVIEGTASDTRLTKTNQFSAYLYYQYYLGPTVIYECLFRLSGKPVLLRLNDPIFIKDGETIRVIGEYNGDGVFEAVAYYNRSAGVTGKEEKYRLSMPFVIAITFLFTISMFLLMALIAEFGEMSAQRAFFFVLIMLTGLGTILGFWIYFVKDRKKKRAMSREIDRLMGEYNALQ